MGQVKRYVYANGFVSSIGTLRDISRSVLDPEYIDVLGLRPKSTLLHIPKFPTGHAEHMEMKNDLCATVLGVF